MTQVCNRSSKLRDNQAYSENVKDIFTAACKAVNQSQDQHVFRGCWPLPVLSQIVFFNHMVKSKRRNIINNVMYTVLNVHYVKVPPGIALKYVMDVLRAQLLLLFNY